MKKVGFRRKINIDWNSPFMVVFVICTIIGIIIAAILAFFSVLKENWIAPVFWGGVGILFEIIGLICTLTDS